MDSCRSRLRRFLLHSLTTVILIIKKASGPDSAPGPFRVTENLHLLSCFNIQCLYWLNKYCNSCFRNLWNLGNILAYYIHACFSLYSCMLIKSTYDFLKPAVNSSLGICISCSPLGCANMPFFYLVCTHESNQH